MTYLALARKWRPRSFEDVVGQPHVVRALANALTSGRVHHAFLFAGTRGVGKTTVARILARCLNCERGVTAVPCGECAACKAIEEGRYVDLIEVDAASRTGIDDIRDLLDNVQYTPTAGRYKVYLVDEVHMLSKAAFNALLKTLEEPPPHVKFLFATTDPQKLPVTVLSRCLQFNLKRLPGSLIVDRMARICQAEGVTPEPGALARLARAAAGSMRDGLSLLDQALAFGDGTLRDADVAEMLGSLDRSRVLAILAAVAGADATTVLQSVQALDELVPDYQALLDDIASALQQIAVLQIAGVEALEEVEALDEITALAGSMDAETVQLYYQIAVTGRRDLPLAPDPRTGFEMALLRMLAFRPADAAVASPRVAPATRRVPLSTGPATAAAAVQRDAPSQELTGAKDWEGFVKSLALDGAARQLALHAECLSVGREELHLTVDRNSAHLLTEQLRNRLATAIGQRLGSTVRLRLEVREAAGDTPAARQEQQQGEALQRARAALESDPNVRDLTDLFGAELLADTIKPAEVPDADNGSASSRPRGRKPRE